MANYYPPNVTTSPSGKNPGGSGSVKNTGQGKNPPTVKKSGSTTTKEGKRSSGKR